MEDFQDLNVLFIASLYQTTSNFYGYTQYLVYPALPQVLLYMPEEIEARHHLFLTINMIISIILNWKIHLPFAQSNISSFKIAFLFLLNAYMIWIFIPHFINWKLVSEGLGPKRTIVNRYVYKTSPEARKNNFWFSSLFFSLMYFIFYLL